MDKEAIKAFIDWLEIADIGAIHARIEEIRKLEESGRLSDSGLADLRLARRLIDEELISRLDLAQVKARHGE